MAIQSNTPMLVPKAAQAGIVTYLQQCTELQAKHWNLREQMRQVDLAYIRETDKLDEQRKAKIANRVGDSSKFQNITVPVVMPQVEAAVTYQTSVFLQGHPIFGVTSNPQSIDEAVQMETVIEDQATKGGWTRELILFFRDGFKYNLAACEVSWERKVTATLETDVSWSTSQAKPKEVIWEGNKLKRLNPYNLIFDTRCTPTQVHIHGEFAGYTELKSRIALKQFIQELPDKLVDNIIPAFESGPSSNFNNGHYYVPELNPASLLDANTRATTNWMAWAGLSSSDHKIQYKDMYEVTTLYARILPSDFKLRVPSPNTPQVWKFIIVNNQVLIYAERQTNAHGLLPILIAQPNEDGLEYQTKSLATNVQPIQEITTAMWNSIIAARRRAIGDRGIYDPSRISEAHINSDNPAAKIPVRPTAYGKPVGESYFPIPFRDDQSSVLMQETQSLLGMANIISGQNQARQGQFVKGNKTLHEFQSVMSNANSRDQLCSLLLEAQFFTPLKEIIKLNILQYQGGVSLYNRERQEEVNIDPVKLRQAVLEFKISDGLLPTDKLINADTMQTAIQVIGSSPVISQRYNLGPLFSYFMKTQGAHITEFEKSNEQLAYENAMQQWQMAVQQIAQSLKGMDPQQVQEVMKSMPPQPQPQQFNFNPAGTDAAAVNPGAPKVENRIYNIRNNVAGQQQ